MLWLLIVGNNISAQHLSIGSSDSGIGFGSFTKYTGINFSLKNKNTQLTGIGLSLLGSSTSQVNGFNIALIQNASKVTGVNLGALYCRTKQLTGISFGLLTVSDTTKGVSIGGLINASRKQKGISISGFWNVVERLEGAAIALVNMCASGKGLQVGIYNCVDHTNFALPESHQYIGVQLGLMNKIVTNRKLFRVLPLINFNFRKLPPVLKPQPIEKKYSDSLIITNSNTMTDPRDGKIYQTIEIGNQTWMAQNLVYAPKIDLLHSPFYYTHKGYPYMTTGRDYVHYSRKNPPKAFCYNDDSNLCTRFGVLYTLAGTENCCPPGWHLATAAEFDTLLSIAARGGDVQYAYEALLLKGSSGFRALLLGQLEIGDKYYFYRGLGESTSFWSSTRVNSWGAKVLSVGKNGALITNKPKTHGYYVRCVKD